MRVALGGDSATRMTHKQLNAIGSITLDTPLTLNAYQGLKVNAAPFSE